jgi:hypothetical protein
MTPAERDYLRELAKRVAEIAALPVMEERKRRWTAHNDLESREPMILVFPEGAWRELLPPCALECQDPGARDIERALRMRIYGHEHFDDDAVVDAGWNAPKAISMSGWGLEPQWRPSGDPGGAGTFQPVIHTPADLDELTFPEASHDPQESQRRFEAAQDLFGDILDVRLTGIQHVSFHLMSIYTHLRGLEEVMFDMAADPPFLHAAMRKLEEGHQRLIDRWVELELLDLNVGNTYHSSGGNSFTRQLPQPDFDGAHVRPIDMWASAESQEFALVSPAMHAEFALAYEKPLLARFGLNGYGCCEDLTDKLDDVLTLPRIRRISMSPWADVPCAAERLGDRAIFSWKPNPVYLVGAFDDEAVERHLGEAVEAALGAGCVFEMILKDTHTCQDAPARFDRWTAIARRVTEGAKARL